MSETTLKPIRGLLNKSLKSCNSITALTCQEIWNIKVLSVNYESICTSSFKPSFLFIPTEEESSASAAASSPLTSSWINQIISSISLHLNFSSFLILLILNSVRKWCFMIYDLHVCPVFDLRWGQCFCLFIFQTYRWTLNTIKTSINKYELN